VVAMVSRNEQLESDHIEIRARSVESDESF
jgi:hypothetical protein